MGLPVHRLLEIECAVALMTPEQRSARAVELRAELERRKLPVPPGLATVARRYDHDPDED